jgi:hypothetical protein
MGVNLGDEQRGDGGDGRALTKDLVQRIVTIAESDLTETAGAGYPDVRRTSRTTFRLLTSRTQATTSILCTSSPAHRSCDVFTATSFKCGRREALTY